MIANINPRGHSFKGVASYLLNPKQEDGLERVDWTETCNLHTQDVGRAVGFMAWTDQNRDALRRESGGSPAGRKAERGSVYHYSLSWQEGDPVDREAMRSAAFATLDRLGLAEHQAVLVSHSDTAHPHIHVVANLVHPATGKVASNYRDRKKLDRWAHEYEQEHGIACEQRARKYEQWERGQPAFNEKAQREERARIVSEAYQCADSGKAFSAALASEGLALGRGSRRAFVVVDDRGDVFALNRLIDLPGALKGRAKTRAINEQLQDLDIAALPTADELSQERRSYDRDASEVRGQHKLAEAAEEAAKAGAEKERRAKDQERAERIQRAESQRRAAAVAQRRAKWAGFQREVARKTEASRKRWGLEELAARCSAASDRLDALGGFWARVFKRKQIAEARSELHDYTERLRERTTRFEADVKAYGAARPAWLMEPCLAPPSKRASNSSSTNSRASSLGRSGANVRRRTNRDRPPTQER